MSRLAADIKERRLAFQLTIEAVAHLTGLEPQRLLTIEAGEIGPSAWELSVVADALACDPAGLMQGGAEDPKRSVARFRGGQAAEGLTGGDLRLLARGAEAGRILAHLKSRLGEEASRIASNRKVCAPSFIAPRDLAIPAAKTKKRSPRALVLDLAKDWGLSFEGAAWHAKNLRLLDPRVATELAKGPKPSVRTEFEPELRRTPPDQFGIEVEATELSAGLLSETAIVACAEGLISRERAAEILSLR